MSTSFHFSRPLGYVLTSVLALALAGCGGSNSNDAPANDSPNAAVYDGSGTEALGSYVGRVSAASGLYVDDHYAPVGLTQRITLSMSGTNLRLSNDNYLSGGVTLVPDPETSTYKNTAAFTYSPTEGALDLQTISEMWVLSFKDGGVQLHVTATATGPGSVVGALTVTMSDNSYSYDSSQRKYFLGRITESTGDSRFVGGVSQLTILDNSPGTRAFWFMDATRNKGDGYYFDAFIRDGDTLTAGGFIDSGYTGSVSNEKIDNFALITVKLDAMGRPKSTEVTVSDYDNKDFDGFTDVEPASFSVKSDDLHDYDGAFYTLFYNIMYPAGGPRNLTVVSVSGTQLQTKFGIAGTVRTGWFREDSDRVYLDVPTAPSVYINGGYVSPTERRAVLWDGRYNDYKNAATSYDLDGLVTTQERWTIDITYNTSHVATGGTVKLEIYDAADALTTTENMTFSIAP